MSRRDDTQRTERLAAISRSFAEREAVELERIKGKLAIIANRKVGAPWLRAEAARLKRWATQLEQQAAALEADGEKQEPCCSVVPLPAYEAQLLLQVLKPKRRRGPKPYLRPFHELIAADIFYGVTKGKTEDEAAFDTAEKFAIEYENARTIAQTYRIRARAMVDRAIAQNSRAGLESLLSLAAADFRNLA